ncbi:DUF6624 domain-containing protein [Flectobacillus roseus]|uniref:Uncharacterized protein n=1 Tax=Flectobacillus roseus TaxID=502259 RepID=A0ABT6YEI7_9BACT|nr:DUF6624 domain-containing protein [Flectobacillus roseus]MDI9862011.1 hypothetical protein [Flectobacillus roseus]
MQHPTIAHRIIELQNNDLALRDKLAKEGRLSEGYDEEMRDLHIYNANILNEIIKEIGFPTIEKVGKEANGAAWLVIQHSIALPIFMKRCASLLKEVVDAQKADSIHYAYLSDRIAVLEDRPQVFGTQFDWDENGKLSPNPIEDVANVNERRKSVGIPNTIEEQTESIRFHARHDNLTPPKNFMKRKQEMEEWKKSVGWVSS